MTKLNPSQDGDNTHAQEITNHSSQVDFFFNQSENNLYEMVECLRNETLN